MIHRTRTVPSNGSSAMMFRSKAAKLFQNPMHTKDVTITPNSVSKVVHYVDYVQVVTSHLVTRAFHVCKDYAFSI